MSDFAPAKDFLTITVNANELNCVGNEPAARNGNTQILLTYRGVDAAA